MSGRRADYFDILIFAGRLGDSSGYLIDTAGNSVYAGKEKQFPTILTFVSFVTCQRFAGSPKRLEFLLPPFLAWSTEVLPLLLNYGIGFWMPFRLAAIHRRWVDDRHRPWPWFTRGLSRLARRMTLHVSMVL